MTLADLLATPGASGLAPWAVPDAAGERPVTDVVLYDRFEPQLDEGCLALGVGLDPGQCEDLLARAARAGAAGIVVGRDRDARPRLTEVARGHGVALLAAGSGTSWVRLVSQLRNVLTTTGGHARDVGTDVSHHDLTVVANSLAEAAGGSVVIFTPQQEILAASRLHADDDPMRRRAVTEQHGPAAYRARLRELGVYRELWSSDDVVDVPAVPEMGAGRRLAVVVRAGEEILGSIWVAEGDHPLAPDSARVLRAAAAAAGGHLVWWQARAQSERRFSEGLLLQLLAGDADVHAVAGWLGVDADQPCAVLTAATPDPLDRRRLAALVSMHLSAYRHSTMTLVSRGSVDLVLAELPPEGLAPDSVRDMAGRVAGSLGAPVWLAVGRTHPTLDGVAASREDAHAVLRVLRRAGVASTSPARVATWHDVRPVLQLDDVRGHVAGRPDLLDGPAASLVDRDREGGGALGASLLAYLDAFGDVRSAARGLHVHANTLRYRVRRACELTGLDLADPHQRLVTHLQLGALLSDGTALSPDSVGSDNPVGHGAP